MDVPPVFKKFTLGFRQGLLEEGGAEVEWINRALRGLDKQERVTLKAYLSGLLNRNIAADELQKIWSEGHASYHIDGEEGLRSFLILARDLA